ncbi:MAG: DUF5011 domain-containing protein [Longicatena sp.]
MGKRCKTILYVIFGVIVLIVVGILVKICFFSGLFVPMLKLLGDSVQQVEVQVPYHDAGVKTRYHLSNFDEKVEVINNVNTNKTGTYTITYNAKEYDKKVTRVVHVVDTKKPVITLKGPTTYRIFENGLIKEPGYVASDAYEGDLSKQVTIENNVNIKKQGNYSISYHVKDSSGNVATSKRNVQVCNDPTNIKLHYNYDDYDNTAEEWWFHKSEKHQRNLAAKEEVWLAKYNTYYLGPKEKVIYLTFDEGGNDITYIKEIAKVLKDNKVNATYFLTRNYIKDNPKFMNELVKDGNVIGNHTWHHYDMTTLANESSIDSFVKEITETEKTYMEVCGQPMKKIFRFPKGGCSERTMKIVKDLGYRTYHWSHAYYDYNSDVSKEEALKTMKDHYHEGAIYLLHPSNAGNYEAMDAFIGQMKELGYSFKTVDTIGKKE